MRTTTTDGKQKSRGAGTTTAGQNGHDIVSRIPSELKNQGQWILWRYGRRDKNGRATKIPIQVNGEAASSTDPETWTTFDRAASSTAARAGLGYVFRDGGGIVGIDLDGCRDPESGNVDDWAREIIQRFGTYTEVSPSRNGFKLWCYGKLPPRCGHEVLIDFPDTHGKAPGIEIYDRARYFTVTGQRVAGVSHDLVDGQAAIDWLIAKYFQAGGKGDRKADTQRDFHSDAAVLDRARKYIAKIPGAVSGQRGHNPTFHVACVLVIDFALSDQDALMLIREWNGTCDPPWSDKELEHKIRSAGKQGGDRGRLRGVDPKNWSKYTIPDRKEPKPPEPPKPYRPFPVDALPEPIRGFVAEAAASMLCDPAYVAPPILAVCGAAIGTTRKLILKSGWTAPPTLWTGIVGESGTMKSPAIRLVLRPLHDRQRRAIQRCKILRDEYNENLAEWKEKKKGPKPLPPPDPERVIVNDTTPEALAPILLSSNRGVLVGCDELAGWLGSFDRYKAGKRGGGEAAFWLSTYNGESVSVDRRTGDQRHIYIPRAAVSVVGAIQPTILRSMLCREFRDNGLMARLMLVCPPRRAKRWTEAGIDDATTDSIVRLVDRLFSLEPAIDDDGESKPSIVGMDQYAKAEWIRFYDAHNRELAELNGDLAAAWSKAEEWPARLALIVHYVRWAASDPLLKKPDRVDAESMRAAIEMTEWAKYETRRVYAIMDDGDESSRDQRRLVDWIGDRSVTARDVQRGCRWLSEPGAAEDALEGLAKAGVGAWGLVETEGRSARRFSVVDASTVDGRVKNPGVFDPCVDVDTVDTKKPDDEGGWY